MARIFQSNHSKMVREYFNRAFKCMKNIFYKTFILKDLSVKLGSIVKINGDGKLFSGWNFDSFKEKYSWMTWMLKSREDYVTKKPIIISFSKTRLCNSNIWEW